jgi:ubiquinone biosynthesis protein
MRTRFIARLLIAQGVFGLIFLSYWSQWLLVRLFAPGVLLGHEGASLPAWLVRRHQRIDGKNARRAKNAMLRLRGVYIKLGQVLSVMGGFLPKPYADELESLQDQVPAQPYEVVKTAFMESFGIPPDECFSSIERAPLAAASLGQVHAATLQDGTKVAVKVLYPDIRAIIAIDLQAIQLALLLYKRFVPVQNIERVHSSLVDLLRKETDYLQEAQYMTRMSSNFVDDPDIVFPKVIPEWTSSDVLTMTFVEGTKITNLTALRLQGIDMRRVATRLVETFFKQVFVHRLLHADPHPGNFLVQKDDATGQARIVFLDFGAVSEVPEKLVLGLLEVVQGLLTKNSSAVLEGVKRMGFAAQHGNTELFERTVRSYLKRLASIPVQTPGALIKAGPEKFQKLMRPELQDDELKELMESIEYPEGWFYIERAGVILFWLCSQIDPDVDILRTGTPYVLPLVMKHSMQRRVTSAVEPHIGL